MIDEQRHAVTLVSEKGASSWLAALPLNRYGFTLTKSKFRDGLALRYGWEPKNLPAKCPCGEPFTVAHSLHCGKGGYTHMRFSRTYFDVKIFYPLAKCCPKEVKEAYKYHETLKKLKYEQRILDVENSSFNPLVFACSGGAGPSASKVISRLALKISEKGQDSYSDPIGNIRTQISFALLRSSVLCIRGFRYTRRQTEESSMSAMVEEGKLSRFTSTILIW